MGLDKSTCSGADNWTRDELVIDREYEIDCDVGEWILVYIETRFDVYAKFGIKPLPDGESWVNLYARYNPITGELLMEYVINIDDTQKACDYEPNEDDKALVIELITAMISEEEDCSPLELIELHSIEEKIEGDIKMPKITKEKIKIDPDFDLNPLVPGDIIVYAEIEMDEPKGTKWLEQFGLNVLSGAFYVRYGMSDKSAEEPGFDLSEDDRALIIEAISEMVQKETGLSPREYYDKNVAEKEKNLEIMKAVISTSLHLTYRDETAPNLTALYKQAQAIREAFEPICPLARDGWGKVLDSIGTYAPCLMRQSSLFVLAYETGDASCRYWDDFVIVNSDENVSVDAIQKCITEYMAGDPPAKADCDYRTMTIDIMDATGYDWHFLDIGLVSINRAYTFWI